MKYILWMTIVSTCLLGATVDTVILRPYPKRHRPIDNAKIDTATSSHPRGVGGGRKRVFKPTSNRCCKIGAKMARKRMSCNIGIHLVARQISLASKAKYSRNPRIGRLSKSLSTKIAKCSNTFPEYFEKCCSYRAEYFKKLRLCKSLKRKQRRHCRRKVKQRYP